MLKALIRVRLASIKTAFFRQSAVYRPRAGSRAGSKATRVLMAAGFGYLGLCLLFLVGMLCYTLAAPLAAAGLGWLYHAAVGLTAVSFCFMGSVFLAQSQIFEARDNELLLSMPVPPRLIVLSRLLSFLLLNCLYAAVVMVPAAAVYAVQLSPGPLFYVSYALGLLLLPMLATALTCAIGWAVTLIVSRMRRKNLVTGAAMIAFFLCFLFLYMNLQKYAAALLAHGEEIAAVLRRVLPPLFSFGMAVQGAPLHLLLTALWCLLPLSLVYLLLSRSFQRLVTTNRGAAKIRYVAREMRVKSPRAALLQKELGRIFGFPLYLFNCAVGGPLALVLAVVVLVRGPGILSSLSAAYGLSGAASLLPFLLLLLCFCAVMDCTSAPSISLEGPYLWIVKANPVRTCDLFFAKVMANFLIGGVPLALASALFIAALPLRFPGAALVLLLPLLAQLFTALMGLCLNLLLPRLDWISQAAVIKQSGSVLATVFGGMGLIACPALLYGLWLHRVMAFELFGLILCLLLAHGCAALTLYLGRGGRRRFEAL